MDTIIQEVIKNVKENMIGRWADAGKISILLETVKDAGDKPYLELGVLHGGSLCAVSLLKRKLGHKSISIGVDLFNGFYFKDKGDILDKSGLPVNMSVAQKNLNLFGLSNVKLVQSNTNLYKPDLYFGVCFVDADHTEEGCWKDWLVAKDCSDVVVFHDYGLLKGVTNSVYRAKEDKDWLLTTVDIGIAVLKKGHI